MSSTAEQMRVWDGPALFSYGFRPFFLAAAVWAAVAMGLWVLVLSGALLLPSAFDPVSWHAHEFLFGYLGAVIAGFMMTAVPNWTGRMPIVGWPLAGLFGLWFAGRLVVLVSAALPPVLVAAIDVSFAICLALLMTREIFAGKNWRNLMIVGLLSVFVVANGVFHWEAGQGTHAAQGYGFRLGLSATLVLVALLGGRIVPSFTRNWLARRRASRLPTPPMQSLDRLALAALIVALLLWVVQPLHALTGVSLLGIALLHAVRLWRWRGIDTRSEPLVWVLHVSYLFLPLGAFLEGMSIIWPDVLGTAPALHVWMTGVLGLMTLAVMTRATLGHTGKPLSASTGTQALYWMLVGSVFCRVLAGIGLEATGLLYTMSGLLWLAAFGGFAILYGPLLIRPRKAT